MEFPRIRSHLPSAVQSAPVARSILGVLLLVLTAGCMNAASQPPAYDPKPPVENTSAQPPALSVELSSLPAATTFGKTPAAPTDPAPHASTDGVVLHVKQDIPVYDAPHGKAFARLPETQFKSPTWVPIVAERGHWARVLLPSRPNHSTGWVWVDGSEKVEKARTPYVVEVDVDARHLVVRKNGREIGSWSVGVGAPGTPTPSGRTFILASIREQVTDYSPIILPLGTHSNTVTTFGGGPGTVGLHGWPDPSVFGTASSHGCVRVPDEALRLLRTLPLGTLVQLR